MKHHQYKLRITAMLLTFLLTATALFGCSTTESTPTEPGTEKLGDLNKSFTQTNLQSILNIPEDMPTTESFITHFEGADEHLREIRMEELIGAEIVIGEVYVPKN